MRLGNVRLSYAVRLDPVAVLVNEWRDTSHPYRVGPSIQIDAEGELRANRVPLMKVPIGEWIRIEIRTSVGRDAKGTYQLAVTLPGNEPRKFDGLAVGNPEWRALRWLGFIAVADANTAIYLDDVKLEVQP